MTGAVIISHGGLSEAFLKALYQIAGEQVYILAVSNSGRDLRQMEKDLLEALGRLEPCEDVILFTDLQGGSCSLTCRGLMERNEHLAVVTGFNMPMLIEFIFYRDRPFVELLSILERKGTEGIRVFRPSDA